MPEVETTTTMIKAGEHTNTANIHALTKERFAPALRLIGDGWIECQVDPVDDYAEEIILRVVAPRGEFHICSLPVVSDAYAFGDNEEQDNEWDAQYRSLGELLASAPSLLAAAERLPQVEVERDRLRAALQIVVDDYASQWEKRGHFAPEWVKQARAALETKTEV